MSADKSPSLIVGRHYPAIDGLRALAVLLVMLFHASTTAMSVSVACQSGWAYYTLAFLGSSGVTLFFLISGFLITGILMDTSTEKHALRKFYIRRSLRIFPLYFAALAMIMYVSLQANPESSLRPDIFYYIFYIQNWMIFIDPANPSLYDKTYFLFLHFWSLAIEEQFYVFWPFVLFFFLRRDLRPVLLALISIMCLISVILRLTMFSYYDWVIPYTWTLSRLDGLLVGALIAYGLRAKPDLLQKIARLGAYPMIVLIMLMILVLSMNAEDMASLYNANTRYIVTLSTIFYAILIMTVICRPEARVSRLFQHKAFRPTAEISYGLYVFHFPVMKLMGPLVDPLEYGFWGNHNVILVAGFLITYAIAWNSFHYFEKPILKLKDRWAPYEPKP